ncbi:LacI family DNA-binding transcriptional regulator [Microbacterium sp. EST19A]|uniref:LacI family DNA-binding transcriptional regulator n=1 Tax=Microbacterium sp. EST19A TaxID=2862681 RepID=UPI001CBBCB66|nr:LacI family DNA-binding transcriptional regulator [Microbacterium sp. EST19A]
MASASKAAGATLRDIAKEVGISVSAVSMALRDHPRIGPDTKAKVLTVADELGYVPNSAGRALRARKADAVALIIPNTSQHVFGHSYFMHVLTGVTGVANDKDAQVVISTNPDESHGMAAYERVMRSGSVDGAIVTSAAVTDDNIERLVKSGLPLVLLGNFPYLPDSVSIGVDDRAAAFEATSHLIEVHQRRVLAHVSGPLDHQSAIDRRDGFFDAVEAHGITGHLLVGDYSEESGARAAGDMAEVDGVFAANDEMAFGAMTRLRERGLAVPSEISIIGFDDFGLSRVTTPSITTMHVPAEHMARLATERLFDLVSGVAVAQDDAHVTLPVDLVTRESCGC